MATKRSAAPPQKRAKRRRSSGGSGKKAQQLFKSLIQLDPYDEDIADNVQGEELWNERPFGAGLPPSIATKSKALEVTGKDKEAKDKADEQREAELDAELPPEYRKFRPRGYHFKLPPTDRPVRIYADGVFDLFHLGHMKQLEQAKKSLPNVWMMVGIPNDTLTHKYKGLTVLTDEQRYETVSHCKWVDEIIRDAPWEVNQEFLDKHQIDYVAHDDIPYQSAGADDVYKFVKERGQFLTTQRTDGVSTSDIITKIIKDYDLYLMRNFARGVSRKDLNVSWIKKNELDIKRHVNTFRESWKQSVENTTRDLYADLLAFVANKYNARRRLEQFQSSFAGDGHSVLGHVRDWVARKSAPASRQVSPGASQPGSPLEDERSILSHGISEETDESEGTTFLEKSDTSTVPDRDDDENDSDADEAIAGNHIKDKRSVARRHGK